MMSKAGSWSFIIGLVIALLVGLFAEASGVLVTLLVVLGLIVGFLNVTEKETHGFLVAAIALILAGTAGEYLASIPWGLGGILQRITNNFVVLVAPAAIVVGVKSIYGLAKD